MHPSVVLFGRDQELAGLARLRDTHACVVVAGEVGIGTSSLVEASMRGLGRLMPGSRSGTGARRADPGGSGGGGSGGTVPGWPGS